MREFPDIIKSFSWPLAFLFFGIVFVLLFRPQIGALILGVRRVSRQGIEVVGPEVPATQKSESADRPDEELMRALDSPVLREIEENIKKDHQNRKLSDSQSVNVLVRYLAAVVMGYAFERIYNDI